MNRPRRLRRRLRDVPHDKRQRRVVAFGLVDRVSLFDAPHDGGHMQPEGEAAVQMEKISHDERPDKAGRAGHEKGSIAVFFDREAALRDGLQILRKRLAFCHSSNPYICEFSFASSRARMV